MQPITIAYFGGPRETEALGFRLASQVARTLHGKIVVDPAGPIPEGPHFHYDVGPELFLGRRGRGPLHVVWDTSVLIGYFHHGRALWERDDVSLSHLVSGEHGEELEALQLLMAMWVLRDIRFYVLRGVLHDAKRKLTAERRAYRLRALDEFAAALHHVGSGDPAIDEPIREGLLVRPESELERALARIPVGGDRALVREAVKLRAHVFLTTDKKVLKRRDDLLSFGLLLASPGDLLEVLTAVGALHCLLDARCLYWPAPDQVRVAHLYDALPPPSAPLPRMVASQPLAGETPPNSPPS